VTLKNEQRMKRIIVGGLIASDTPVSDLRQVSAEWRRGTGFTKRLGAALADALDGLEAEDAEEHDVDVAWQSLRGSVFAPMVDRILDVIQERGLSTSEFIDIVHSIDPVPGWSPRKRAGKREVVAGFIKSAPQEVAARVLHLLVGMPAPDPYLSGLATRNRRR
jgi:hypothetical protein